MNLSNISLKQCVSIITHALSSFTPGASFRKQITMCDGSVNLTLIYPPSKVSCTLRIDFVKRRRHDVDLYVPEVSLSMTSHDVNPKVTLVSVAVFRQLSELGARLSSSLNNNVITDHVLPDPVHMVSA
jgi:hypothetical protein